MDKPNFPALEQKILKRWKEQNIFKKTLQKKSPKGRFVFFEGPPTANGKPGIHHALARAFKDLIPRFKTMQGFKVERRAGWDTQGLPVEIEVEKELKISGKKEIEQYGVEAFNKKCRESVWKYKAEWEKFTERLGFWIDFDDHYITYDPKYIETLWWIFKQIHDAGYLYRGHRVVPHCPRCETALSSHELAQGYKKVKDRAVYVKFELVDEPGTFVLAWTTTPWTLPGNVALAVKGNLKYVLAKVARQAQRIDEGHPLISRPEERVYVEKTILERFQDGNDYIFHGKRLIPEKVLMGKELEGKKYRPLFDFLDLGKETGKDAYKIVEGDFVTTDEGTGVVHTAVMYGEDDYNLGTKLDLPKKHTVNPDGTFNELVKPWVGKFVKSKTVEDAIVEYLEKNNRVYKTEEYEHDYPFCWRCQTPLLYYAKDSWFIKMSALRKELIASNKEINWIPDYIKEGRFGEWLSEVKDWAISRERYWGTPLPIWRCVQCGEQKVIGSFPELEKESGKKLGKDFDPHKPFIDEFVLKCKNGHEMKRTPEVADTWFDSGSMPFAQWHYPFENKERVEKGESYPAAYIAEAIDQTRGWFYTLLAVATLLTNAKTKETKKIAAGSPYQNIICLGLINDAKGQKMSKSRGNVIDPWKVFDQYGADALRFHLYTVNQPGDTKNFDLKNVDLVVKKTFLILWNIFSFRDLFPVKSKQKAHPDHILDRWLDARTNQLVAVVTDHLEAYRMLEAGRAIADFVTDLSTWYLRRSRDRFKNEATRAEARACLDTALGTLIKLLAPFTPFLADELYSHLGGSAESVHLEEWPAQKTEIDLTILDQMEYVRTLCADIHSARAANGKKVREIIAEAVIVSDRQLPPDCVLLIGQETNVQKVIIQSEAPTGMHYRVSQQAGTPVYLDLRQTDELEELTWLRELARHFNDLRKQASLHWGDRNIVSYIESNEERIVQLVRKYGHSHLAEASQSRSVETGVAAEPLVEKKIVLGNFEVRLSIERVG